MPFSLQKLLLLLLVSLGFLAVGFLAVGSIVTADELKTRFTTIVYADEKLLHEFNDEIFFRRGYLFPSRRKQSLTLYDDVAEKLDAIIERVELTLEMFPGDLKFTVTLLPDAEAVQRIYKGNYHKSVDYIAYYSPKEKTIYLSVKDINLTVLAHEIAHAVVDHYFEVPPPVKIHEMLAQHAAAHITD